MKTKQIAVFAKSAKNNNFCVAGFDLDTKNWLRPISDNPQTKDAVTFDDATYLNGDEVCEVKIFDVVEIKVDDKIAENPVQPENFYYAKNSRWKKIGETDLKNILKWRGYDDRQEIFFSKSCNCRCSSSTEYRQVTTTGRKFFSARTELFHLKKLNCRSGASHFCFCR